MDEKKLAEELYEEGTAENTGKLERIKKSRPVKALKRIGRGTKVALGTLGPIGIGAGVWQGIYQSMVSLTNQLEVVNLPVQTVNGTEMWGYPMQNYGYVHEVVFKPALKKIPIIGQYLFDFMNAIQLKFAEGYVPQFFKYYMEWYAASQAEWVYGSAVSLGISEENALKSALRVYERVLGDPRSQESVRNFIKYNVGLQFAMYDMVKIEATIGAAIVAGALLYHNREHVKEFAKSAYRGLDWVYKKVRRDKK